MIYETRPEYLFAPPVPLHVLAETPAPLNDLQPRLSEETAAVLAHVGRYEDGVASHQADDAMANIITFATERDPNGEPYVSATLIDLPVMDWGRPGVQALQEGIETMFGLTPENWERHTVRDDRPETGNPLDVVAVKGTLAQDPRREVLLIYRPSQEAGSNNRQLIMVDVTDVRAPHVHVAVNSLTRDELDWTAGELTSLGAEPDEVSQILRSGNVHGGITYAELTRALHKQRGMLAPDEVPSPPPYAFVDATPVEIGRPPVGYEPMAIGPGPGANGSNGGAPVVLSPAEQEVRLETALTTPGLPLAQQHRIGAALTGLYHDTDLTAPAPPAPNGHRPLVTYESWLHQPHAPNSGGGFSRPRKPEDDLRPSGRPVLTAELLRQVWGEPNEVAENL